MFIILKKEFNAFFTSTIGYLVIGLFLIFNSLFLWFFKGSWNIFNAGFADLQAFFDSTPWLLLFLAPAISMRLFSDEYNTGTIEILKTRPFTDWQLVLGKFFAALSLLFFSLLPTFIYAFSISKLAAPAVIDWGSIVGSYVGLFLLAAVFIAVSIFASVLSKNQIVSFLLGLIMIFVFYYGIEQIALWYNEIPKFIQNLSLFNSYNSMGKGVLDSRDVIYYISLSVFFLFLTKQQLNK